jgi:hypothetical protein
MISFFSFYSCSGFYIFLGWYTDILVPPRSTLMSLSFDAFQISDTTLSRGIWAGLHLSYNEDENKHGFETFDVLCWGLVNNDGSLFPNYPGVSLVL